MEITANAIQTVAANNNVLFTETAVPGNCSIVHRAGSGLVNLRGLTSQCRARFKITFGANMATTSTDAEDPIQVVFTLDGEPINETAMIISPTEINRYSNISRSFFIDVPRNSNYIIAVRNTTNEPVSIQNANLIVERVA